MYLAETGSAVQGSTAATASRNPSIGVGSGRTVFGRLLRAIGWSEFACFATDRRASTGVVFGLSLITLVTAVGGGIDLGRAFFARQQLSNAATLACQYASRNSVVSQIYNSVTGILLPSTVQYQNAVTNYLNAALVNQHFPWAQTASTPFVYNPGGSGDITITAKVPTTFMAIVGISSVPVSAVTNCFAQIGSGQSAVGSSGSTTSGAVVAQESFENSACSGSCWSSYTPNLQVLIANPQLLTPTQTPGTSAGYVGTTGQAWVITGYCLEVDAVGLVSSAVPNGTHSAELDCDNGQNSAGNSSISTKVYLAAQTYELRWSYFARVDYPQYDPVYICGSAASDVSWATSSQSSYGTSVKNNEIDVFLDANTTGTAPVHRILDGTQTLAGSNLIDTCVYSQGWVQRSVSVTVTTPGYYWLSFAANGANNSFGGEIDSIMMCVTTCTGSVTGASGATTTNGALASNFPPSWTPANNANANKVLFEDTFESPSQSCRVCTTTTTTLDSSYGTSGSSSGWPNQSQSGWTTSPYDQVEMYLTQSAQGNQSVGLDQSTTSSQLTSNRSVSRQYLLNPGYYEVQYDYISNTQFPTVVGQFCVAAPSAGAVAAYGYTAMLSAKDRITGTLSTAANDTNIVGVFMSNALLVSAPSSSSSSPTATYTNPDGTTTSTPKVPLDGITISNYNTSQPNQLIDLCGYSATWMPRTTYVKIQKTGYYWLTFAGLGTADSKGGAIDDVKLTALGGLTMTSPPSSAVAIPVPGPQPGSTISYTGFNIVAESAP